MATVLLQVAGSLIGSAFGPVGTALGAAAGAAAGYWIDQSIINSTRRIEGPRLGAQRPMTAQEGVAVPRVYGMARIAATVIWATRFEEVTRTERRGAKGGPRVTTYSYHANVALGLCEGPVAAIRRIWADGQEIDLRDVDIRLHHGTEDQEPDPLILARQGEGNTPAYRGLAYLVLEHFALEAFGNRIPQFEIEVFRPVGKLERDIRAITLIPGATEHGLAPGPVMAQPEPGALTEVNRHVLHADTDWQASLDDLQAVCPNLEHVALVVAWFGTDLRAGHCEVRPGVTARRVAGENPRWMVGNLDRNDTGVRLVSAVDGRPAYGGTPSDASVIAAIRDLKARGLKVTLHPFVMMDIPADNALPDPHGAAAQPPYPWRGRITCHPAPGRAGTVDGTANGAAQVGAFFGTAAVSQSTIAGDKVSWSGAADWRYRRFVLHLARLCQVAGGVDAFLLGSELPGLTRLRDGDGNYPAVAALRMLASDLRGMLGPETKLTYGADWSEYFGHHPQDGSGDVRFHLDPLWADPVIDAVAINNYMPLSDWRDEDHGVPSLNPDGMRAHDDAEAMAPAITAGEGHDWYYASVADRARRIRTPITDGLGGTPWIYRYKDIAGWWSNLHHERTGGVISAQPTAWQPGMKPVWFTELGCGAVHAGATEPNRFPDPKSVDGGRPMFSSGARADGEQRAFLEAHLGHWQASATPIVDPDRIYLWAWDARPWPAFPVATGVWSDGANWLTGHWLNGRLGAMPLRDLVAAVFADHGLPPPQVDGLRTVVQGLVIDQVSSVRDVLEPLALSFGLDIVDAGAGIGNAIRITDLPAEPVSIDPAGLVQTTREPVIRTRHSPSGEMPSEVVLRHRDGMDEYRTATARARDESAPITRQAEFVLPCIMDSALAEETADRILARMAGSRRQVRFSLPLTASIPQPGESFVLGEDGPALKLVRAELTGQIDMTLAPAASDLPPRRRPRLPLAAAQASLAGQTSGKPAPMILDLPLLGSEAEEHAVRIAARIAPDAAMAVFASPDADGFEPRSELPGSATMGTLENALAPGREGLIDHGTRLLVRPWSGTLASVSDTLFLSGRNLVAVEKAGGVLELLQFRDAEEIAPGVWELATLLRGQAGTGDAAAIAATQGARFVLLDARTPPAGLRAGEAGLALNWRIAQAGKPFTDRHATTVEAVAGLRARRPLSPVHLRVTLRQDGALELGWVRRTRRGGDNWDGDDVPLAEDSEAYAVRWQDPQGTVTGPVRCVEPRLVIGAGTVAAVFGSPPASVTFEVAQLSASAGEGMPSTATVPVRLSPVSQP